MLRFALLSALVLTFACGDDTTGADDPAEDASLRDAGGAADAGRDLDGGSGPTDAGADSADAAATDAAAPTDAAPARDLGASPCEGQTLGTLCREGCPGDYACIDGVCLPSPTRAECGGVAGARCTTRTFPNCTYYAGADHGPCLSEHERACACSALTDRFDCSTRE